MAATRSRSNREGDPTGDAADCRRTRHSRRQHALPDRAGFDPGGDTALSSCHERYLDPNRSDAVGGFGCILMLAHDWPGWEATKCSYELFARHWSNSSPGRATRRRAPMAPRPPSLISSMLSACRSRRRPFARHFAAIRPIRRVRHEGRRLNRTWARRFLCNFVHNPGQVSVLCAAT